MLVLNDVLGYKERKIYQDDRFFKFSLDGVLLSNFVNIKLTTKKIMDIGSGTGIIPLLLTLKTSRKIDAVEIQPELCELLSKSIKYNNLENQINIINKDIIDVANDETNLNKYDIVVSNPPYFENKNNATIKNNAKHENLLSLEELVLSSKKVLKNNGSLYLVFDSKRIIELISILDKHNFAIKRMKFVHESYKKESSMVLLESTKNGKKGVKIMNPFILFEKNGIMTEMYQKIYRGEE